MKKPEIWMTNLKLFIKDKTGFLVAGWTANKGKELHGDYVFVKDRKEWEKVLECLVADKGQQSGVLHGDV